ncbi:S-layer homology domain-containing protein [Paenibacillus sp. D2_2]|uniref:S-layer homology domain-containing protein n=1 Tax=Paenibacillus sp. D2_2 TaxID=3073092 RepID=UPI00281541C7|nr:S-layer homology domain-containing protein [Paenibacillus sp. D2_2]WMT42128.1 S-layer homology domain-containing protein [Paenibacillus sp. D2_2]
MTIAAVVAAFMAMILPVNAAYAKYDVNEHVLQHTRTEIVQKMEEYAPERSDGEYLWDEAYEEKPNINSPYSSGKLKEAYIWEGIKAVNLVRYLAGLPDDVEPDFMLGNQQQAAALLNAVNGELSHYPSQPQGMSNDLFNLGANGAKSSNIAYGADNFMEAVIDLYMADSSEGNIDRVGHRRWILNPTMKKTMFGAAIGHSGAYEVPYSNMYSFDKSRASGEVAYEYIGWPSAGSFPLEVWHAKDPWSIMLNPDVYDNKRTSSIKVTMTRKSDGRVWSFGSVDQDKGGKYFTVDTANYAVPFCIIFRPDSSLDYKPEEQFHIEVTGLYSKGSGQPQSLAYDTQFFNAEQHSEQADSLAATGQVSAWAEEYYLKLKTSALLDGVADSDHSSQISRLEFTNIAFNLYKLLADYEMEDIKSPFNDIDQARISHAAKLGIIQGTSAGQFSPNKKLTRQEAVVVLMNLYKKLGGDTATLASANSTFTDDADIAAWAKKMRIPHITLD